MKIYCYCKTAKNTEFFPPASKLVPQSISTSGSNWNFNFISGTRPLTINRLLQRAWTSELGTIKATSKRPDFSNISLRGHRNLPLG